MICLGSESTGNLRKVTLRNRKTRHRFIRFAADWSLSACSDGAGFWLRCHDLHSFGQPAAATRPRHIDHGFSSGGYCRFQPTAIFFHGHLLSADHFTQTICTPNTAGIGPKLDMNAALTPFRNKGNLCHKILKFLIKIESWHHF